MSKLPDQELADIGIFTDEYQRARTARLLNERPHTKPAPVAAPCANGNCADCNLTPCQCKVRAAPCAGCTSARTAITEALRLYAGGHEHGDVLRAWLKEHP